MASPTRFRISGLTHTVPQLRPHHKCGGQIVHHTFGKLRRGKRTGDLW
uniref:Uncharacterized protein n=1 Tax=Arundo donax TaxID=35708 RepID=A0A0A9F851_ARUDO